jgi:hypothetical protein
MPSTQRLTASRTFVPPRRSGVLMSRLCGNLKAAAAANLPGPRRSEGALGTLNCHALLLGGMAGHAEGAAMMSWELPDDEPLVGHHWVRARRRRARAGVRAAVLTLLVWSNEGRRT